eukprot:CFRG0025T1
MSTLVAKPEMLYLQHDGCNGEGRREASVEQDHIKMLRPFRILASLLQEVKDMLHEHKTFETETLFKLFASYGGPVNIVLDLSNQHDGDCSAVHQALRNIAIQKIKQLKVQMNRESNKGNVEHTHNTIDESPIAGLNLWEDLCKPLDNATSRLLYDRFDGMVQELLYPSSSLGELELTIRRVRSFLTYNVEEKSKVVATSTLTLPLELSKTNLAARVKYRLDDGISSGVVGTLVGLEHLHKRSSNSSLSHNGELSDYGDAGSTVGLSEDELTQHGEALHGMFSVKKGYHLCEQTQAMAPHQNSYTGSALAGRAQQQERETHYVDGRGNETCDSEIAHTGGNWLGKAELPRRPFKSRECDFFKQGKCSKDVCNFAHGNKEKDWWTALYQGMIPCKTPGCLGRANGCLSSHSREEQLNSKFRYEDMVNNVTLASGAVEGGGGSQRSNQIALSIQQLQKGTNSSQLQQPYGTRGPHNSHSSVSLNNEFSASPAISALGAIDHKVHENVLGCVSGASNVTAADTNGGGNMYMWDVHGMSSQQQQHDSHNWLGKNDLPRPFRSKKCDFYSSSGLCIKPVCNYAHDKAEMLFWSDLFQTMFRCNNKTCNGKSTSLVGKHFGCSYSHSPDEQLANMQAYETAVANAKVYSRQAPGKSTSQTSDGISPSATSSEQSTRHNHEQYPKGMERRESMRDNDLDTATCGSGGDGGRNNMLMMSQTLWNNSTSVQDHPQQLQHYNHQQMPFNIACNTVSNLGDRLVGAGSIIHSAGYSLGMNGRSNVAATKTQSASFSGRLDFDNSAPCRPDVFSLTTDPKKVSMEVSYKADEGNYRVQW